MLHMHTWESPEMQHSHVIFSVSHYYRVQFTFKQFNIVFTSPLFQHAHLKKTLSYQALQALRSLT